MIPSSIRDGTYAESIAMSVGTEASNLINVVVSAVQGRGQPPAKFPLLTGWISDSSDGSDVASTAPTTLAIQTGGRGTLTEHVANKVFSLQLNDNGQADVELGKTGVDTWYIVIVDMDGTLVVSGAITFA